jgi:hypothetical protein
MKLFRNLTLTLGLSTLLFAGSTLTLADEPKVTVYKTPTCGCCKKWVTHLEKSGFEVETIDMRDLGMIKSMSGVEPKLASCHTAQVGGYVIEGHVPADDIKRLLSERPAVKGLTAPGMPHGSPGMETGHKAPYQVLTFDAEGKTQVFAQH